MIVNKKEVVNAIDIINKFCKTNKNLPVMNTVVLDISEGTISSFDLETEVIKPIFMEGSIIEGETTLILPKKEFFDIIKNSSSDTISIKKETQDTVRINDRITLSIFNNEDYPNKIKHEYTYTTELVASQLKPIIRACDKDYYINVIFFDNDNIVCTDGHRMHILPNTSIIPFKMRNETAIALSNLKDRVNISVKENKGNKTFIQIKTDSGFIINTSDCGHGFPNYKQVIPEYQMKLNVSAFKLKQALMELKPLFGKKSQPKAVVFELLDNFLVLNIPDEGEVSVPFEFINNNGFEFKKALNGFYLLDTLESADKYTQLTISIKEKNNPLEITDGTYYYYVMGIKM